MQWQDISLIEYLRDDNIVMQLKVHEKVALVDIHQILFNGFSIFQ